jgi:hypothetical protein
MAYTKSAETKYPRFFLIKSKITKKQKVAESLRQPLSLNY